MLAMNCLEYYEAMPPPKSPASSSRRVNYRLAPAEMLHVLRDATPRILVFEAQYGAVLEQLRAQLPDITHYICIGRGPEWAIAFEAVVAEGDAAGPPIAPRGEDYAYLWYTSGTTGRPKGVPWRQVKALESARCNAFTSEMTGATRVLQVTPLFHIGGKGYAHGACWAGGAVVLHRGFDPVAMLETIQRERITMTFMVAAMLQAVLDVPNVRSYDLSSLEQIITAAAPVPVPILRRGIEVLGRGFRSSTELRKSAASRRCRATRSIRSGPPKKFDGSARWDTRCPKSTVDWSTTRARNAPWALPARWWCARGWCSTSTGTTPWPRSSRFATAGITPATSASFDEQRYLYLVDRKKDMIVSGGENIYSREVEDALASQHGRGGCGGHRRSAPQVGRDGEGGCDHQGGAPA